MFKHYLDKEIIQFDKNIDSEVGQKLEESSLKIAVAESLTGGQLSFQLMKRPGSSVYFLGGVICYNTRLKVELCGVKAKIIQEHGEVSREVASSMAEGIKQRTRCDIAIATTGVAGPASQQYPEESVGKVFIGCSFPTKENVKKYQFEGSRETIIQSTCRAALVTIRDYLRQHSAGKSVN